MFKPRGSRAWIDGRMGRREWERRNRGDRKPVDGGKRKRRGKKSVNERESELKDRGNNDESQRREGAMAMVS